MKYTLNIDIDLPRDRVVQLFDSRENAFRWMEGLVSFDPIKGEPGESGAQSRLVFQIGKRRIEMIETITRRELPQEFSATYEAPGVFNRVENLFEEVEPGKTRWTTHNVFRFKGFMKVLGFLMPGSFRKQSYKYLEMFKRFAEEESRKS